MKKNTSNIECIISMYRHSCYIKFDNLNLLALTSSLNLGRFVGDVEHIQIKLNIKNMDMADSCQVSRNSVPQMSTSVHQAFLIVIISKPRQDTIIYSHILGYI